MIRSVAVVGVVGASLLGYMVRTPTGAEADGGEAGSESAAVSIQSAASSTTTVVSRPGSGDDTEDLPAAPSRTLAHGMPAATWEMLTRVETARQKLRRTRNYAATFTQQVRKDGELLAPEQMQVKVQHDPFAVYLKWEGDGQEALYVDGAHRGKLLVHPTRGLGRLRRVWEVDPAGPLALRTALRPVTEIGLLNLVDQILEIHVPYIIQADCEATPDREDNRRVTRYTLIYDSPAEHPDYSKTILTLANETDLPIRLENFDWQEDGKPGELLESYAYADICMEECVEEADFDRDNDAYGF